MNSSRRIDNAVLLIRCLGRAFLHGRADKIPEDISRIIVMPDGKLGDVVCGTPVLAAIRKNFPKAHIIVGGNALLHKALLSDSTLVDEYLEFGSDAHTLKRIKECRADVALVTGLSYTSTAFLYLAGTPFIIAPTVTVGYSPLETRSYKVLKQLVKTFPYRMGAYAPRERLRVLEPLGIVCDDTTKHLGFSETADEKIGQFFIANGIPMYEGFVVGVSPSAGHKIKEWPEERFGEVIDHLIKIYHAKVVLIGGPSDVQKVEKVLAHTKNAEAVTKAQGFDLDELKALISHLDLFVSVDTGPMYIAEAFDVPTIDIIGPIDENEQPPRGPLHRNVVPPDRIRPELFVLNARSYNKEEALRQVRSTTVSLVEREIDLLITDLRKENETGS